MPALLTSTSTLPNVFSANEIMLAISHWLGHIRGRIDRLHPEIVLDCSPRFFDIGRRPNPVEHDVGASTRECPRIRETDAAGRAGHDCDFTFQNIHFAFPC